MGEAQGQQAPARRQGPPPADLADLTFEDALAELEEIVKSLEGGRSTLAQAIADYERGAALRRGGRPPAIRVDRSDGHHRLDPVAGARPSAPRRTR